MKFVLVMCHNKKNAEALCHLTESAASETSILVIDYESCFKKFDYELYKKYDYVLAFANTTRVESHGMHVKIINKIQHIHPNAEKFVDLGIFCTQPKSMTLQAKVSLERFQMKYVYIPQDIEKDGVAALHYIRENTAS